MNKEVHYEGWLIKSPPTKRIWRARWRRRWFTLKQGEIPEQFCLEYYTDRNCRKLKGVIDLDQCEQVDCGLRLENRKQKFQFMFDIKTPRRTYYLAADTEADMRDWVNCICQVCHLHDTKQSSDLPEENQTQSTVSTGLASASISSSSVSTSKTINTTTTSLNVTDPGAGSATRQSINAPDILRRPAVNAIEQQPQSSRTTIASSLQSNDASAYVNTEYTNRETMLCETRLDGSQGGSGTTATAAAASATAAAAPARPTAPSSSPASPRTEAAASGAAVYLNSSIFNRPDSTGRLAVSSSGIVRKIPENLVLNNTPLIDTQQSSVQPSPALSTASGPYIPISECFSGSPKILLDGNKPTTPLSHFDPKFYDTPRSHSNIVLNLNKDQSHSPRITNIGGLQQPTPAKSRSGRSDSDSESVFTDDEEWAHPMPLRENIDRSTRPSDSSVENESFVFTYSQRFSKLPEDISKEQENSANTAAAAADDSSDKLNEALKNENISILDIKENEKTPKEQRQRTDAENSSPAIGPGDAKSVVDESYDIPRSHNLPYCNMGQLFEKGATSPEGDPIASSTPNLIVGLENISPHSPSNIRTLPRPHCYTNAAPSKVEGNVFSYDFMEQVDLPPVNRSLKPKVSLEDKPPEEVPAKPPIQQSILKQNLTPSSVDGLANKLMTTNIQSSGAISKGISATITPTTSAGATTTAVTTKTTPSANANAPLNPPSVDRKLKPNAYKFGNSATMGPSTRRSTGAPLSMVFNTDNEGGYIMQTRTLPRHPRPSNFTLPTAGLTHSAGIHSAGLSQQQRAAFAAATFQMAQSPFGTVLLFPKNEHKLQYFDLDVSNPPPMIHRQSMSVGNLNAPAGGSRFALSADPSARAPVKSGVVYNSVDFVKTEAFKLVREERIRETEVINNLHK